MMNISINVCDLPHRYDTLKSIYSSIKLIIQRLISLLEQKNRNADEKFLILCLTLSRIPSFFGYSISKKKSIIIIINRYPRDSCSSRRIWCST